MRPPENQGIVNSQIDEPLKHPCDSQTTMLALPMESLGGSKIIPHVVNLIRGGVCDNGVFPLFVMVGVVMPYALLTKSARLFNIGTLILFER